ncbi:MAG TPA: type II secretion system F family protein [Candidatus Rifleibacterium sp.]|nr:type II secretion system F family protein [Candidatus Rifleibacterium sp.]HPT48053.1 type II secretion system F family protein [Candidatus Rifleibacterium sp.]
MVDLNNNEESRPEGPGEENRSVLSYINPFYGHVGLSEQLLFTKYFATLTRAGISVLRSLGTLSRQMKTWRFKKLIWEAKEEVEGGLPLNVCFKKHDDIFGLLYANLIKVGEESGRLFLVLDRLSKLMERAIHIRRRVIGAMTYPLIISAVAGLVVTFLMLFIIPQFANLFAQFNQELPWITQQVIDFSNFLGSNVLILFAAGLGFIILIYQINQTAGGRRFFDWVKLKIPVFGTLLQKYLIALYARNLATLFESGINIISAMKISNDAVENVVLQAALNDVVKEVEGGIPIARALAKVEIMPELSTQMIEVGEESGNLDEMLEKVAEFYEDEINFLIDQITAMVEPVFILVIGAIVGVIVLAMYLPIFKMARVVSGGSTAAAGGA